MLFSKNNFTAGFINNGQMMETVVRQKPAKELMVKLIVAEELRIATVVSALLDRNEAHLLEWFKSELRYAETERRSWEEANQALQSIEATSQTAGLSADDDGESGPPPAERPTPVQTVEPVKAPSIKLKHDNPTVKSAILKNGFLRLLMTLCGLQQIGDEEEVDGTIWIVPSHITADRMISDHAEIKKAEFDPLTADTYGDGQGAIWHIKPQAVQRMRVPYDDGSDGASLDSDQEMFPPGGPTNIHKNDALALLRKKRTNIRVGEVKELTEGQKEDRKSVV